MVWWGTVRARGARRRYAYYLGTVPRYLLIGTDTVNRVKNAHDRAVKFRDLDHSPQPYYYYNTTVVPEYLIRRTFFINKYLLIGT